MDMITLVAAQAIVKIALDKFGEIHIHGQPSDRT